MKRIFIKCFKCEKEIERIHPDVKGNLDELMWLNGLVGKITAGYGSELDGDTYLLAVCDDCIMNNKHLVTLINTY